MDAANCLRTLAHAVHVDEVKAVLPFDVTPSSDVVPRGASQLARLGRIRFVGFGFVVASCPKHAACKLKLDATGYAVRRMECKAMLWLIAGTTMDASEHARVAVELTAARRAEVEASNTSSNSR